MFNIINLRLQQVIGSNHLFGGVSIIAIGKIELNSKQYLINGYLKAMLKHILN